MTTVAVAWRSADLRPLSDETLTQLDGWFRAANYLSVGLICLLNNQLLRNPLSREDVKPQLLGHWGTTPGLNFIYAHLNRVIKGRRQHGDEIPEVPDWVWPDPSGARVEAGVGGTVATAGDNE